MDQTTDDVFTGPELSAYLKMGDRWEERHRGRIPGAFRVGREWRYDRIAIEKAKLAGQILMEKKKKDPDLKRAKH